MKALYALMILAVFAIGVGIGGLAAIPQENLELSTNTATSRALSFNSVQLADPKTDKTLESTAEDLSIQGPVERDSPSDWIKEREIEMRPDGVLVKINNPQWAILADTNSMDPVFDDTSHLIQIHPMSTDEIKLGDIVSYQAPHGYTVVHRVIEIGEDEEGWYAILKGDNNPQPDPWKVRFDMVRRVTVMVVY